MQPLGLGLRRLLGPQGSCMRRGGAWVHGSSSLGACMGLHMHCSAPTTLLPMVGPMRSHTNRLATEKSPYLLQHAHNPVDWYAWGPEALEKAKREDK